MRKILIIEEMHPSIIPKLESLGYCVDYEPEIVEDEVLNIIHLYEGLIVRSKIFIDERLLKRAIYLKFIARAGAGMDQILEDEVRNRGIKLINAPEGNRDAVAEHTVGLLLALFNNITKSDREIRKGVWLREENRGFELKGKTVAIIGYGNNGAAFAKRLISFGCNVIANDIIKSKINENATFATLEEIFSLANIVSFHIPLTSLTLQMGNKSFFESFHQPFWLLNVSRGQVVSLKDLLDKIEEGKILGAGLDVLEKENLNTFKQKDPLLYSRLMNCDKVVLTSHIAGWTKESLIKINEVLYEKIKGLNHL